MFLISAFAIKIRTILSSPRGCKFSQKFSITSTLSLLVFGGVVSWYLFCIFLGILCKYWRSASGVIGHAAAAKSFQSCLTLWDPMDCSLPGSSVHGIFQARVLEWAAIAFSGYQLYVISNQKPWNIKVSEVENMTSEKTWS